MSNVQGTPADLDGMLEACASHAEDLLRAAELLLSQARLPNVAYHLATVALEEIGKAEIVGMEYSARATGKEIPWSQKHMEDHVRKLFWALWGPSFAREVITRDQVAASQGLARRIHATRLSGLYVRLEAGIPHIPRDAVSESEAQSLISLATARLGLQRSSCSRALSPEDREDLLWFTQAAENQHTRGLIVGGESMRKLPELGSVAEWIRWLRRQFEQAEALGRCLAERELSREEPQPDEAAQDKWQLRVRFRSSSHSIRPKPLQSWNSRSSCIRLRPVDRHKDQLDVEFVLPKAVQAQALWWAGYNAARRFVVALNIGSGGCFWWHLPQHVDRFYEKLVDLEQDCEVVIEKRPALKLDWGRGVLSDRDLANTSLCWTMLPRAEEAECHEPFDHYSTGLAFLAKNDIHLQLEANAYEQFYRSLQSGMAVYGDWDRAGPFAEAFHLAMSALLPEAEERDKYLRLGEQFEVVPIRPEGITLTEVGEMKLLCDAYFLQTFARLVRHRSRH